MAQGRQAGKPAAVVIGVVGILLFCLLFMLFNIKKKSLNPYEKERLNPPGFPQDHTAGK